ncbi:O-antigen ligase family protein [Aquipuribacter sp. MA13-6]|uniref:O-antigen ligase family protein n=1 Tax=unclassified Aquipuribacter TaxID=2635084 RepID=UPI003EE96508
MSSPPLTREAQAVTTRQPWLPLYVWAFTIFVPLSLLSGNTAAAGVPLPLDRLAFAAGLGLLLLTPAAWQRLRLRPVNVFMVLAVLGVLISAATAGVLSDTTAMFALLDRIVVPFFLFCLAPLIWSTPRRRALLLRTLVLVGVYLGVTAVLEMTAPQLVWPQYIVDPEVGIQFGRARGPFVASEAAGLVMGTIAAASALAATRFTGWWRALAVMAVLLCLLGTVLTQTRSIWLGAVVALVVVCVLEKRMRLPALAIAVLVAVLGLSVVASVPSLSESFTERATTSRSVHDRENTNSAALRVIADRPLDGVGWTRFATDEGMSYVRQLDDIPLTNVRIEIHNIPLSRAAETGLPAATLYLVAVVLSLITPLLRRQHGDGAGWRLVALASAVMWLIAAMLSPVPYPTANYLVWLFAGIAAAPLLTRDGGDPWADAERAAVSD